MAFALNGLHDRFYCFVFFFAFPHLFPPTHTAFTHTNTHTQTHTHKHTHTQTQWQSTYFFGNFTHWMIHNKYETQTHQNHQISIWPSPPFKVSYRVGGCLSSWGVWMLSLLNYLPPLTSLQTQTTSLFPLSSCKRNGLWEKLGHSTLLTSWLLLV